MSISRFERDVLAPSRETLIKLADVYATSLDELARAPVEPAPEEPDPEAHAHAPPTAA